MIFLFVFGGVYDSAVLGFGGVVPFVYLLNYVCVKLNLCGFCFGELLFKRVFKNRSDNCGLAVVDKHGAAIVAEGICVFVGVNLAGVITARGERERKAHRQNKC